MDENVHPQTQGQPALDPSLVNAKLNMALAPEIEMTNQLLGKGDSDSLKVHFRGGFAQPAYGAGGKAAPPPGRKLSQAGLTFLANTSTIPGKKVPHDVLASIAGQADQTCENSPVGAPTVSAFVYMGMGERATTTVARGPLAPFNGARKATAALCVCEEEGQEVEAVPADQQVMTVKTWVTEERI